MKKLFFTILLMSSMAFNNKTFNMEQSTFNSVKICFIDEESRNNFNMHSSYVQELGVPVLDQEVRNNVEAFLLIYNLDNSITEAEINILLAQKSNPILLQHLDLNNISGIEYKKLNNE